MSDVALRGDELKKLLKIAKKRDLAFAYSPGKSPAEDIYSMDRKKKPDVVSRAVRKESEGTKYAFGYVSVKGKIVSLKCERELPGMSKKLKKFFKSEKCPMNVVILDQNGNVLEEDIEELPEDDLLDGDDADENEAEDNVQDAEEVAPAEDDTARRKQVTKLASEVKAGMADLPEDAKATVSKGFVGAVKALQGGKLDQAEAVLNKLKAIVDKMAGGAAVPAESNEEPASAAAPTAPQEPAAAAPPPPPPPTVNPVTAKLMMVAEKLEGRIATLEADDDTSNLRAMLEDLRQQIESGDAKGSGASAKALGEEISKVSARQSAAAKATREETFQESLPETPENEVDHTLTKDGKLWNDARADLEGRVLALLKSGMGDVGQLRADWASFMEKGNAQEYVDAMNIQPNLLKLIAEGEAAEMSDAEKDIPENVVPFVRARLDWIKARTQLRGEMGKLQNAILAVCKGEDFAGVADDTKELFSYLDALDDKLENALEALVEAPDGAEREDKKKAARSVLGDFQAKLETPFFKDVDTNNGFVSVSVRGTAVNALSEVGAALS